MKSSKNSVRVSRGNNKQQYRADLDPFEYVDVENVCYASDEDLYGHLRELVDVRERGVQDGADTVPVEKEIDYIRRELRIRADRREAHERYVMALQNENAVLEQAVVMATPVEAN